MSTQFLRRTGLGLAAWFLFASTPRTSAQAQSAASPAANAPAPSAMRALSLDEALAIAARESETLRIAQIGVMRANGQFAQARSSYLPQVNATANVQRLIQSQFQAIANATPATPSTGTGTGTGSSSSSSTSGLAKIFASPNTITLGVTASQTLFNGGRVAAQVAASGASRSAAERGLTTTTAQLQYDVASAYYDAIVADRLAGIADSSLQQAERSLKQTTVARQVGTSAEFDLLRARVARDNLKPQLYAALSQQEAAYAKLASILNIPFDQPLQLTTVIIEPDTAQVMAQLTSSLSTNTGLARSVVFRPMTGLTSDSAAAARTAVQQLADNVDAQRHLLWAAKAQRIPSLQLSTTYQRFAYPDDAGSGWGSYYPNWTASLGMSLPLFTGGRVGGDIDVARANVIEAEQRLQQAKEGAAIEARLALNDLRQSQAAYVSNVGTDAQAAQAYRIAEVRYAEGVSTQLELIETRNQLVQARANRAVAARNLALAQLKLKLLKDLPISQGGSTQGSAASGGAAAGTTQGGSTQQSAPRTQTSGSTGGAQASAGAPQNQE